MSSCARGECLSDVLASVRTRVVGRDIVHKGNGAVYFRSNFAFGLHSYRPIYKGNSLTHTDQPQPTTMYPSFWIKSCAGIANQEMNRAWSAKQVHLDLIGPTVPDAVPQSLLGDPKQASGD